jgi:hypothetical protein
MLHLFRRKIFLIVKYFQPKNDFFENILWRLACMKKYQQQKITGDEIPSLADKIPAMKVRIWHSIIGFQPYWLDSDQFHRNLVTEIQQQYWTSPDSGELVLDSIYDI